MPRLLGPVLALLLLVGAGFVTRPLFKSWLDSSLKEAEAANRRQMSNWKSAQPDLPVGKFTTTQPRLKINLPSSPPRRPSVNTLR